MSVLSSSYSPIYLCFQGALLSFLFFRGRGGVHSADKPYSFICTTCSWISRSQWPVFALWSYLEAFYNCVSLSCLTLWVVLITSYFFSYCHCQYDFEMPYSILCLLPQSSRQRNRPINKYLPPLLSLLSKYQESWLPNN